MQGYAFHPIRDMYFVGISTVITCSIAFKLIVDFFPLHCKMHIPVEILTRHIFHLPHDSSQTTKLLVAFLGILYILSTNWLNMSVSQCRINLLFLAILNRHWYMYQLYFEYIRKNSERRSFLIRSTFTNT